jgi:DNA sulfur modification protein DndC
MYRGATQDNECPLVVDTSTPSCGDSRFGCFVCTLVDKDKSMQAMITNDKEKEWMIPLAKFRDEYLDISNDFPKRDFRRMHGGLTLMKDKETGNDKLVHGPYLQSYREKMLLELLKAQEEVRKKDVPGIEEFQLITDEEVEEIRRIWVKEKNEIEDSVPQIYREATGKEYAFESIDEGQLFKSEDIKLLRKISNESDSPDDLHYQLVRNLLNIERNYSTASRRNGIYEELEKALTNGAFENKEEALEFAKLRASGLENAQEETQKIIDQFGIYETHEEVDTKDSN